MIEADIPFDAGHSPTKVIYLLPHLGIGGAEVGFSIAYPSLASSLKIECFVLDRAPADLESVPHTPLSIGALFRLIRERREYVLVTSFWRAHLVGMLLQLFGVRWVAFFHTSVHNGHVVNRVVTRVAASLSEACMFDSRSTKAEHESRASHDLGDVVPFIFHTSLPVVLPHERHIDLTYVGRFVAVKRIDLCIELCKQCIRLNPAFRIAFIGLGPQAHRIAALEAQFPDNVVLHGRLENQLVRAHLRRSRMNLCLSNHEGMAMAVVEGIQDGCVPVVRMKGEMRNYLDHHSAVIHDESQPIRSLASRVVSLAKDDAQQIRLNKQARTNLSVYTDYPTAFVAAITKISARQPRARRYKRSPRMLAGE